ncbi:hypothetical protein [Anaerotardibacter muris]|uniref:hypothetical protein n=1 Tax=Anaerotardibacter muris TaxID=2941505 RepID=UPI00203FD558|nr:hypothetical protein [Anaerotardibacter muris]
MDTIDFLKDNMDAEIKKILDAIQEISAELRNKSMFAQQEDYLNKIDSLELVKRIRKFRSLNLKSMSESEVAQAVSDVLTWNGLFIYLVQTSAYPQGTQFFRIRKLNDGLIPNETISAYGDLWEPPEASVKVAGRLNKAGESLLYVAPMDPTGLFQEVGVSDGDWYALIRYSALDEIKVNVIGGQYDYEAMGITDETALLNNEIINDFLKDEFSKPVGKGTEYLYKASEIIAKWYFDLPSEDIQDAWAYSSVHDTSKYNVCFRPEIAHKLLKLDGAMICKKGKGDSINVYCIALGLEETGEVLFYPLGSEQQKQSFPEIKVT